MDLAKAYAAFRGSSIFLVVLASVVAIWVACHFLFNLDPDLGGLNTILSAEASISLAFFTMLGERQSRSHNKQMAVLADSLDEIRAMSNVLIAIAETQRDQIIEHKNKC